jgi:hypothetical protein
MSDDKTIKARLLEIETELADGLNSAFTAWQDTDQALNSKRRKALSAKGAHYQQALYYLNILKAVVDEIEAVKEVQ